MNLAKSRYLEAILFVFVLASAILLFSGDFNEAFARAGGGRSSGSGNSIIGIILAPFFVIYSVILARNVAKKAAQTKQAIDKFSSKDPVWNTNNLIDVVNKTYFAVQNAWMMCDQSICREFVTDRLFNLHKMQTDKMIANNRKNILENVSLDSVEILQAVDYRDDSKDYFRAYIKGSMKDYEINTHLNILTDGDKEIRSFTELWLFKRNGENWLLDEIDSSITIADIKRLESFESRE
jgi:hypothetical protein